MRWVGVLLLSGCSSVLGIEDFKLGDAGTKDGDVVETGYCLGPPGWRVCVPAEPEDVVSVTSSLNLTTPGSAICKIPPRSWTDAGQPSACFIVGKQVMISASLQFTGTVPVVIVASDSIKVGAPVDVSSHVVGTSVASGPGASNQGKCVSPTAAVGVTSGGPGGAGGSFVTRGGDGGTSSATGTTRGVAAAPDSQLPLVLRPGCDGGTGGNSGEQGGFAGRGGGAIYLLAGNRITVTSYINASGSAGGGSGRTAGGGGGGSGGMIHLHAPNIDGNGGVLLANGGGGGGGGTGNLGGQPGAEPAPNMPSSVAQGGSGGGATGGNGAAGTTNATAGGNGTPTTASGGGGGGGGAGFIRSNVALQQITTSPQVMIIN